MLLKSVYFLTIQMSDVRLGEYLLDCSTNGDENFQTRYESGFKQQTPHEGCSIPYKALDGFNRGEKSVYKA